MPAKRPCPKPGCPTLINKGERACPEHRADYERRRGTRQARGYDREHLAERARWLPAVIAGRVRCRRCRQPIAPGEPWDLGHPDAECDRPRAPEHQACNRSAGGRARHAG